MSVKVRNRHTNYGKWIPEVLVNLLWLEHDKFFLSHHRQSADGFCVYSWAFAHLALNKFSGGYEQYLV